jgi:hypothetical protein
MQDYMSGPSSAMVRTLGLELEALDESLPFSHSQSLPQDRCKEEAEHSPRVGWGLLLQVGTLSTSGQMLLLTCGRQRTAHQVDPPLPQKPTPHPDQWDQDTCVFRHLVPSSFILWPQVWVIRK